MHARFVTSVIAGVTGGFVVVASQAFIPGTVAWLAFGVGVGLLVLAAAPVLFRDRGIVGLALDGLSAGLAAWTIVASLVFSGNLVKWLSFSEGAGFVALALAGLTLNQVRLARGAQRRGVETTAPIVVATPVAVSAVPEIERPVAVAA